MKKVHSIFILFILLSCITNAQDHTIGDRLHVGISVFYYQEGQSEIINNKFSELSLSTSFNINLSSRFYLGLRNYLVRARGNSTPAFQNWSYLLGPTVKYSLLSSNRMELYGELGFFFGNYCPNCFPTNEYFNQNLQYWSILVDLNIQPFKSLSRFWITLGFATNNPIGGEGLHGYNLPLIGIQYRFGNNKVP